jgi:hypothetical protein
MIVRRNSSYQPSDLVTAHSACYERAGSNDVWQFAKDEALNQARYRR